MPRRQASAHNGFTIREIRDPVPYRFTDGRRAGHGPQAVCVDSSGTRAVVYWRIAGAWHVVTEPLTEAQYRDWDGVASVTHEVRTPMAEWLEATRAGL